MDLIKKKIVNSFEEYRLARRYVASKMPESSLKEDTALAMHIQKMIKLDDIAERLKSIDDTLMTAHNITKTVNVMPEYIKDILLDKQDFKTDEV